MAFNAYDYSHLNHLKIVFEPKDGGQIESSLGTWLSFSGTVREYYIRNQLEFYICNNQPYPPMKVDISYKDMSNLIKYCRSQLLPNLHELIGMVNSIITLDYNNPFNRNDDLIDQICCIIPGKTWEQVYQEINQSYGQGAFYNLNIILEYLQINSLTKRSFDEIDAEPATKRQKHSIAV